MTGKVVYFTVTCKVIGVFTAIPGTNNKCARIIARLQKTNLTDNVWG